MKQMIQLSLTDFRMVFRDSFLRGLLLFNLSILPLLMVVVPLLDSRFPVLADYHHIILMWAGLQTASMFGFIVGFLFLEEKDEQVFTALRVLPVSGRWLLSIRLLLAVLLSALMSFLIIYLTKLVQMSVVNALMLAGQYSLIAPLLALSVAVFARNKVEGLAQFKIYNLLLTLPGLVFFLSSPFLKVLALVPTYWTFQSINALAMGEPPIGYWSIGMLIYLAFLLFLVLRFERKMF